MTSKQQLIIHTASCLVKLVYFLSRALGLGEGTNLPGKVALKIFPNLPQLLIPKFRNGWILITGTNGKTTTTKILVELMRGLGYHVVTNARGANLITGIMTSLLLAELKDTENYLADYAVFEIDEAVLIKSFALFNPQILVVTNFSRDQLDRYGEVDSNVNRIMELLQQSSNDCKVILNGNDPNIARIGSVTKAENRIYFGIKDDYSAPEGGLLVEKDTGSAIEAASGLPELDIWADSIQANYLNGSSFRIGNHNQELNIEIKLPGVFNILNVLAATAVSLSLSADFGKVISILRDVKPSYGRSEQFCYGQTPVFLFLVKNPVGFNHILNLLSQSSSTKRVLFLLNDLTADGKDVSWIWDVALENLWKVEGIKETVSSGTRAGDMALRVKYSDPPPIPLTVDYSPQHAFKGLAGRIVPGEELIVLANYTSMIKFRPFLLKICS